MNKLIITCYPSPRSTEDGFKRILREVQKLAASSGINITWKEESKEEKS